MTEEQTPEAQAVRQENADKELNSDKPKSEMRSDEQTAGRDNQNSNRPKVKRDSLEELSDLIVERAISAHPTLKAVLAGTVEIFVKDRPYRAIFDFVANPPKRLAAGTKESDCIIECEEKTLLRIHQGDLNPQLAMVSDKMIIKGKSGLAVYFFNLLGD